ncbi:cytochrome b/b6 domain-containing protein [Phaeobacter marinintestinus]|uniref:cytochrome b/b6 domain-containing protein n=1 Tax=Falsiphaeobacter marinintestinus TaxID=1492905 RepID=UPI0011B43B66|nr:cytochrome b/b6 domain-containing protein [Phaeobacter marinintestinus]
MSLANSDTSYGGVAKFFHWSIALLILTVIPLGIIANGLAEQIRDPGIETTVDLITRTATLFSLHKTVGVTIFFLALARIGWALTQPRPGLLNADKKLEAFAAETVHWLLYSSLVLVPLTGWIHHSAVTGFAPIWWPFGQSLPFVPKDEAVAELFSALHIIFERVLLVAVLLHIAGALKHHIIDRDATLRRMLPLDGAAPQPPHQSHSFLPPLAAVIIWAAAIGTGAGLGLLGHEVTHTQQVESPEEGAEETGNWIVQSGDLTLIVQQFGNDVTGSFADWTADIQFDNPPAPGPAGQVTVTVSIPSLTLGSVTDQAMGPDFFDSDQFPTASFTAQIEKLEDGFVAKGPLAIKGAEVLATLPFTLEFDGDTATMQGDLTLNRQDFNIGANMPDESALGFGVSVNVNLTATRGTGN